LLLVSAVVMGVTLQRIYVSASSALLEQHLQEVSLLARSIDNELSSLSRVADDTASFLGIHGDLQETEIYEQLRANVGNTPLIYGAALAFEPYAFKPDQRLFAPYVYDGDLKAIDISVVAYDYTNGTWDWYSRVKQSGQSGWSEPYFDDGAGNHAMTTYSTPVMRDDIFIGVATVDLRLDELSSEIASQLVDQRFMVMSPTGRFVAHFNPALTYGSDLHEMARLQPNPGFVSVADDILAGKSGFSVLRGLVLNGVPEPGNVWVFHTPIANTGWRLAAFTSEAQLMAPLLEQIQIALLGMSLTVLLIFVLVWLVSSRLTRPIKLLEAAVSDVARGRLDTQIQNIRSMDEIGRLSIGFNRMLKNLKKQIELQSQQETAQKVLEREMQLARETQRALLPSEFPPFPERREFDLHAVSQAALHVAGDFFDFFLVNPRTLCIVIADVSGKGMSAALVMAVTRTIIRDLAKSGSSPADILRETNERLRESQRGSAFVTVFLGFYQIGNGRLIYANGGHPPPWLVTRHGQVQSVGEATGTIVGMLEQQVWRNAELRLQPGEMLVLYTDGFPEARTAEGEFYGSGRIRNFLGVHAQANPDVLCEAVVQEVAQFQKGNLADDLTLLALRRNAGTLTSFFRTN
jgi:sigma-B regulation protein RsbU (phosphoserine phosphatase)